MLSATPSVFGTTNHRHAVTVTDRVNHFDKDEPFNNIQATEVLQGRQPGLQRAITRAFLEDRTAAVLAALEDPQSKAEFLSRGDQGAAYLTANPKFYDHRIEDSVMIAAVKLRLGIGVCPCPQPGCPLCKKTDPTIITPQGSHVFSCMEAGKGGARGLRTSRHGIVLDALHRGLMQVARATDIKLQIIREPLLKRLVGWTPKAAATDAENARGDLSLTMPGDTPRVFDLVITHPIADKLPSAALTAGAAAAAAHTGKITKYTNSWTFDPDDFRPLAMETGGRMHPSFVEDLRSVAQYLTAPGPYKEWSAQEKAAYALKIRTLITTVSVAVTRATSLAVLRLANACKNRKPGPLAPAPAAGAPAAST